jgi:L-ascorbate metabolism protein UlaG (beta-lactamase superfamily)
MNSIGERLGPFDVTLIEAGQYHKAWPDWHIGPEQAVTAHAWLRGRVMVPIHWGLFALAYHGWTEPGERVLAATRSQGVTLALPVPGQSVDPTSASLGKRWWPEVPWVTGAEDPIVSTKLR